MGAGQSLPSQINRQKAYELTKSTRGVMNVLLEYMLKELSVRDFYLLSNPTECKKYVLFLANNMYKQFYELSIAPTKDKQGVIAFRSIKDLVTIPESEKLEHQSLCVILSYFYTRIFQILGALSLTLIDDASIMSERGLLIQDINKQRLYAPGVRPFITSGGQHGGLLPDLGIYNFIKSYLITDTSTSSPEYGYRTRSPNYIMFFKRGVSDRYTLSYNATFTVGYKGARQFFFLDLNAKSQTIDNTDILIQLKKLRFTKKGSPSQTIFDVPLSVVEAKTFHVLAEPITILGKPSFRYSIKDSDLSISEYFENMFGKLGPYVGALIEGNVSYLSSSSISDYSLVGEKDIVSELRLERTIRNLTKEKPLAHCLARALQLLRSIPIKGTDGESSICKTRFLDMKEGVSRSGLPLPGANLDTSPGLHALSQLFYDTVQYGMPKISMSTDSIQKYTAFMRTMSILFGDNMGISGTAKSDDELRSAGLKGTKNRRDGALCGTTISDINVPSEAVPSVYLFVQQLYKKQIEHAGKCGAIFKMLFNIQQDKASGRFRISLNDRILKLGISEINKINSISRDVLIDYYKNCESIYVQGMKTVLDSRVIPTPMTPEGPVRT